MTTKITIYSYLIVVISFYIFIPQFNLYADDSMATNDDFYKCNMNIFDSFKILIYRGQIAKSVRFDFNPKATRYRSALQRSLSNGVNFAGHYSVATWGCGSNCIGMSIVDAISGEVMFYSGIGLSYHDLAESEESYGVPLGVLFAPDSKLLMVNPTCETSRAVLEQMKHLAFGDGTPRFYVWTGNDFSKIK